MAYVGKEVPPNSIGRDTLADIVKHYEENGARPRLRKKHSLPRPPARFISPEDINRVVDFIKHYAEDNAIMLPGRQPGHKDWHVKLLPNHVSKASVWRLYVKSAKELVTLSSNPLQPGPMYFLTPRKCGLFGVSCEGLQKQVNYLIDEGMSSTKGSNEVISYMHHFFGNFGVGETEVDLHCDNCSGQNKNNFMLWYLAWRVGHKLHDKIEIHFLIAGHTKFSPDCGFGLIKQAYMKTRVNTLADIAEVVENSSPVSHLNIPQLVGTAEGKVLVQTFDWQQHLTRHFRRLPQIKSYQHFSFEAKRPGVVLAKSHRGCTTCRISATAPTEQICPCRRSSCPGPTWTEN
ncbi:uncharacterized protein LOC127651984 [Xyrauchen texanus]|uniref:uncharacterized protein LOC127651984 n=1 Tax=Xyrauchen texanus TaxID=154827 RepID=UPI0022427B4E|nr:uncharacterized protein LOC127651984 [Xyrauchen texanus]